MMLCIARYGEQRRLAYLDSVAERTEIPLADLEPIVGPLREAGLIRDVPGSPGELRLAVRPAEISVERILTALGESLTVVDCVENMALCIRSSFCETRVIYRMMRERLLEVVRSNTLADLMEPVWIYENDGGRGVHALYAEIVTGCGCSPTPKPHGSGGRTERCPDPDMQVF
jgi:Rrf2 family iron-sulfur cluster assembly transcriptional regulator